MTVNPITSSGRNPLQVPTRQNNGQENISTATATATATDDMQKLQKRGRLKKFSLAYEATSLRTQILGLIQDSIERSDLGPLLLNAVSALASNSYLLKIEEETLLKQNGLLDTRPRKG
jgi:predicted phage tail protein